MKTDDASAPPRPARLLIVDDEAAHMKALCDTLDDQGFRTSGFVSAKAALVACGKEEFDLVLTDLMMPEMDGIELLREALKINPNVVGIIMTGEGTIATAVEAMKIGALDYILKPFKLSVILPVLSRAMAVRNLRLKNEELERQVKERTIALEAANQELEAFCYSVSHDLRAPVRHINGYAGLLTETHSAALPGEAQDFLKAILTSAERMNQLIDDLLRLSQLGRQHLSMARVNVSELVKIVTDELMRDKGGRTIEIRISALPDCVADKSLLRQVYVNLLSNAFKFTRDKNPAVIEAGWIEQGDEKNYFVRDNGAGFDMRYAGKLFGVFQRLHDQNQFEGTGVGLSIVHRIIRRHGGKIRAESAVDQGATFYFNLAD